ncbi:RcnB family protein [Brevundimonas sp. SL130]|uniref:RcnB family protein n=1 Tax=Brevundimonas sp. SL130 TaxID=2995143 RepID=UPI00226C7F46|nr:RcnB family protein [Brevundimonas sp. SL130]WAC61208.1 RcnB family protein [Brevundimonas sp. SL130]
MKRLLMAFTAVAAVAGPLAAPVQALAQEDQPRREQRDADRPQRPQISRGERPTPNRPNASRPEAAPPAERPQNSAPRPDRPRTDESRPSRPDRPNTGSGSDRPSRPDRPEGGWNRPDRPENGAGRPDRPDAGGRPERPGDDAGRPDRPSNGGNRPDRPNDNWNRPSRPDRPGSGWNQDRDRHDDFRRRFNSDQWRRDFYRNHRSDWWRNDRRFHGYSGVRIGFYFAPGWGYYSVPRSYWGRYWSVGNYLPDVFWRYRLEDWRTYGLGYPPEGTRWVLVDNTIYLIDEYDGYIIDVIRDAWRW